MIATLLAGALAVASAVPAHVQTWYSYGLNGVNAGVAPAVMARFADFVEDDGLMAEHAMAFKRAGGRYAVAYTDPAYVPYCHPPFAPPAGRCEGPIGDLTTSEDAWLHGPDGSRVHRAVNGHFDHQEALNPASPDARRAWRRKTELLKARLPALDFIYADDAGGPFETWFTDFNARATELPTAAAFRDALAGYLGASALPLIVNGYDDRNGLPSYGGAIIAQPFVRGEARENCLRGETTGLKTDRNDKFRYHEDGLLAVTALHRWAICFTQGPVTLDGRLYTLAAWWLSYDPQWSVFANMSPAGITTLLPELAIVPTRPLRSATRSIAVLRTPGGAYVREFRDCYQDTHPIGPCAALVNPSAGPVGIGRLAGRYGHTLRLRAGDAGADGAAEWAAGTPRSLAAESGAILAR